MTEWYCMECHDYFKDMKKHLNEVKHRSKLYSPQYEKLCKYKNCIGFGTSDGYCNKHLVRVLQ